MKKEVKVKNMNLMKGMLTTHFQKKVVTPIKTLSQETTPQKSPEPEKSPMVYEREMREFPSEFVDELHENE
jgi:hypothetical protein